MTRKVAKYKFIIPMKGITVKEPKFHDERILIK